jgi:cytochrome c oxidase subunit 2
VLGTVAFDQRVVFDFDLPVGESSQNANLSPRRKVEMKYSIRISLSLLIALLFAMSAFAQSSPRRIEIHAHRFSFTPEEITVKRGEPVTLALTSDDVPHSLLIEGLHINAVMTKGHVTEVKLTPEMVGDFKGRCGHFCGSGHGSMALTIHVGDEQ